MSGANLINKWYVSFFNEGSCTKADYFSFIIQVQYLLCALGNGHVFNFRLDVQTGELGDQKECSLGTLPISLRAFSFKNRTLVFAASDRPTIIYSSNKELFYNSDVNLKELSNICPLNIAAFTDR